MNMYLEISVNKKQIPYLLILSVAGVIISIAAVIYHLQHDQGSELFIMYLPAYIPIFVIALYYAIISWMEYRKTLSDNTAKFILTDEGITDNLSIFSCGQISWQQVISAGMATIPITGKWSINHLVIAVANPDSLLQHKSKWKQWVLKRYIKRWGSPVAIAGHMIKYDLEELGRLINRHAAFSGWDS